MATKICKVSPECDGWVCGETIKKNSIPADRLELDSLKELLREIVEQFFDEDWFEELFKELLKEIILGGEDGEDNWFKEVFEEFLKEIIDEDWLKNLLCQIKCFGQEDIFEVEPRTLVYESDGGEQTFLITVGAEDDWTIS